MSRGLIFSVLLLVVGALGSRFLGAQAKYWTPDNFPNPNTDIDKCGRGVPSWICDPDRVLSKQSADVVEGVIQLIAAGDSPYSKISCGPDGEKKGFEIAVAIMQRFQDVPDKDDEQAAEAFAHALHAKWGVGRRDCQNGVLLLLAIQNRQLYISTGAGAKPLLSWDALGNIISRARPLLRAGEYDDAVEQTVVNIGLALAGKEIEPEDSEEGGWFGFGLFAGIAGLFVWSATRGMITSWRGRRRYSDCRQLLERLKRDQASLAAGAYQVTSCPICLEDFAPPSQAQGQGERSSTSSTLPEEQEPLMGPSNSSSRGARPGAGSGPGGSLSRSKSQKGDAGDAPSAPPLPDAPPRQPVVLMCGHVFCEACLASWVVEQRKRSCPICRASVEDGGQGPSSAPPPSQRPPCSATADEQQQQWEREFPDAVLADRRWRHRRGNIFIGNPTLHLYRPWTRVQYTEQDLQAHLHRQNQALSESQARERLRQELMFRIHALRRRYPEYVTPAMANTWATDVANGHELSSTQMAEFQLKDPQVRSALQEQGARGSSSHFGGGGGGGGGFSSGGRGGSW